MLEGSFRNIWMKPKSLKINCRETFFVEFPRKNLTKIMELCFSMFIDKTNYEVLFLFIPETGLNNINNLHWYLLSIYYFLR